MMKHFLIFLLLLDLSQYGDSSLLSGLGRVLGRAKRLTGLAAKNKRSAKPATSLASIAIDIAGTVFGGLFGDVLDDLKRMDGAQDQGSSSPDHGAMDMQPYQDAVADLLAEMRAGFEKADSQTEKLMADLSVDLRTGFQRTDQRTSHLVATLSRDLRNCFQRIFAELSSNNQLVVDLRAEVRTGFQRMTSTFIKIRGDLESIATHLNEQKATVDAILEVVTDLMYKQGIEQIEAAYDVFIQGSHNLELSLEGLGNYIYALETQNAQSLRLTKIKEFITVVLQKKGEQAMKDLGDYIITVKAKFLFLQTMFYCFKEDKVRLQKEYEKFNRDTREIFILAGLVEIYEGEMLNGLRHGYGKLYKTDRTRYEGGWSNGLEHGHGMLFGQDGSCLYNGSWSNGLEHGQGMAWSPGGRVSLGFWKNGVQDGKGNGMPVTCTLGGRGDQSQPGIQKTPLSGSGIQTSGGKKGKMAVLLLGGSSLAAIKVESWGCETYIPDIPVQAATKSVAAAVLGSRVFLCHGAAPSMGTTDCFILDTSQRIGGSWNPGPSLIWPRNQFTLTAVGNTLVAIGGRNPSESAMASVEILREGYNSWQLAHWTLSLPRHCHCAVAVSKTEILVAGGSAADGDFLDLVEIYNIHSGNFRYIVPMPERLDGVACAMWENKILLTGGHNFMSSSSSVMVLDIRFGVWSYLPPLQIARAHHTLAIVNDVPMVWGGEEGVAAATTYESYAPDLGWSVNKLHIGRANHAMVSVPCP